MAADLPGFYAYRRRLPHFRAAGATYFVTWRLYPGQPDLDSGERSAVVLAVRHFDGQRYDLSGFVVMNDHVHLLLRPQAGFTLERILHSLKSFTARTLQKTTGRVGRIWQDESFDRVVRSEDEYLEKLEYVVNNPRKRWPETTVYPWVWVADRASREISTGTLLLPVEAGTEAGPTCQLDATPAAPAAGVQG
ncbi:MAG: transposase [Candidatus Sericytochromatia bacterium]|nr:transposase [Candidatus Tanganyikabacteria bacterium]